MKAIRVGLLGLGTVGSGVVKIIQDHQDKLMHQIGCPVLIQKVLVSNPDKKEMWMSQERSSQLKYTM